MSQDELVTFSLIDFKAISPKKMISTETSILFKYLIKKLQQPPRRIFSLKFKKFEKIKSEYEHLLYYSQISREYNVLVVGHGYHLVFYDLKTRKKLFDCEFERRIHYFEIVGNDLLISCGYTGISRYNFDKIMWKEPLSSCLIWKSRTLKYIWGFAVRKGLIYVCEFDYGLYVLNYDTGMDATNFASLPKLIHPGNIIFTQYDEMVVCGLEFTHLYTLSEDGNAWICKKKVMGKRSSFTAYSIFYERASERIFVSDSEGGTVMIFDRDLNPISTFKVSSGVYGVNIDESTGYLYLCRTENMFVYK